MAHEILAATNAVVTLDVAIPGIVWPWLVTVNMWAKSIGTGVIFMLFMLLRMHPESAKNLRLPTAIVAFVFINIFLLFTLADLHQPFRMWHIFVYSNFTSAIAVGSFMASGFLGLLTLLVFLAWSIQYLSLGLYMLPPIYKYHTGYCVTVRLQFGYSLLCNGIVTAR